MTKKNAVKRAARARQARLGGNYLHHRAIVAGSVERPFAALVRRIIALALARYDEQRLQDAAMGFDDNGRTLDSILGPPPPGEAALREALSPLSFEEIRKLEVLMYAGRENSDPRDIARTVHRDTREITASIVASKLPLHEYLESGLRCAAKHGVDLETNFG